MMELLVSLYVSTSVDGISNSRLAVVQTVSKFLIMQQDEPLIHF